MAKRDYYDVLNVSKNATKDARVELFESPDPYINKFKNNR